MDSRLLAFAGVALVLVVVPGPALAVVLRNAAMAGKRAGLWTTAGIATAVTLHATASTLGLSALLARSAMAFQVVKYVGAAYLLFLGVQSVWRSWRSGAGTAPEVPDSGDAGRRARGRVFFRQGLLTNVLNPKPALFYLAVLPQFIAPGEPVVLVSALLLTVHLALLGSWYAVCVYCVAGLRSVLAKPPVRRAVDRLFGAVLLALGTRVALE